MKSLHFNFKSHLFQVVSSDGCVFENRPDILVLLELQFLDDFSCENLTNHCQRFQLPNIDVCTAVTDQCNHLRVFGKGTVLEFAWNLYWEMFDGLMRVKGRVQHVEFLLQNCQESSIRTVLNMQDRVIVMFDFFND